MQRLKAKEKKDNGIVYKEERVRRVLRGWDDKNNAQEGVWERDKKDGHIQLLALARPSIEHGQHKT